MTTGVGVLHAKNRIEKELTEQGKCYHSLEEAYYQLRHGIAKTYVSLHIDNATVCHGKSMGEHNVGVKSFFRYTDKDVPLIIFIPKITEYTKPMNRNYYSETVQRSVACMRRGIVSMDLFGLMELDCKEPIIEKAIVTNITCIRH